jgi:hypothetical protein
MFERIAIVPNPQSKLRLEQGGEDFPQSVMQPECLLSPLYVRRTPWAKQIRKQGMARNGYIAVWFLFFGEFLSRSAFGEPLGPSVVNGLTRQDIAGTALSQRDIHWCCRFCRDGHNLSMAAPD